jgi:hypothetical protein
LGLLCFVILLLCGVAVIAWWAEGSAWTGFWIGMWVIFAFVVYYGVGVLVGHWHNQRITTRLADAGAIIGGRMLHCQGSYRPSGKGKRFFQVTVEYDFTAPTGMVVTTSRTAPRTDLWGKSLPQAETPVYILYLSDKEYYLL